MWFIACLGVLRENVVFCLVVRLYFAIADGFNDNPSPSTSYVFMVSSLKHSRLEMYLITQWPGVGQQPKNENAPTLHQQSL